MATPCCSFPLLMRLSFPLRSKSMVFASSSVSFTNSPTCQMTLDIVGDFLTDRRQLKQFVFDDGIVCLFGLLPVHVRLVPQIVRPIHGARSVEKLSIIFYLMLPPKVSSLA